MPTDVHPGRATPVFTIEADPQQAIQALTVHGLLVSVQTGRPCPCGHEPNCSRCGGLGKIYGFQREFLSADEDAVCSDGMTVDVFRRPLLRPVSVERLISGPQGGIRKYEITGHDENSITIDGVDLPKPWQKLRATHYFDRFERVTERPEVNEAARTVIARETRHDGEYRDGNTFEAHADIAGVLSVRHESGHEYAVLKNSVNVVRVDGSGPPLEDGRITMEYLRAPLTAASIGEISDIHQTDSWSHELQSGDLEFQLEPWYEVTDGDVIVIRSQERTADAVMSADSIMWLPEFEVSGCDDVIADDGRTYRSGTDFTVLGRQLRWIGDRPDPGRRCSIRYSYRPAYTVHRGPSAPNTMERKRFQVRAVCRAWSRGSQRERGFTE